MNGLECAAEGRYSAGRQAAEYQFVKYGLWLVLAVSLAPGLPGCRRTGQIPAGLDAAPAAGSADGTIEHTSENGPVRLTVRLTPSRPRLSDSVELDIVVTAPKKIEIRPPVFGKSVGDFLVRDYSERTPSTTGVTVSDPESSNIRVFRYQLEPAQTGKHLIRAVSIEFLDQRDESEAKGRVAKIESEPFEVTVTSELGEQTPDLAGMEPMLPPQPIASAVPVWWILPGTLILATALFIFWRRRLRQKHPIPVRIQTPQEIARAALSQLLSENLPAQRLFREFYIRLTGIVRNFIEGTTGLRAPEQTTEEFLAEMRHANIFPAERSLRLKDFLEAADMVKYAGQEPSAEQIELSVLRAREFVDLKSQPETGLT